MTIIQDFFGLLMQEAPPQNCINTTMVKSITDDHVVFCLVSNTSLFRAWGIRPICLCLEINDYIYVPQITWRYQKQIFIHNFLLRMLHRWTTMGDHIVTPRIPGLSLIWIFWIPNQTLVELLSILNICPQVTVMTIYKSWGCNLIKW